MNALERFGLLEHNVELHFREHNLSLNMLHQLWCASRNNGNDSTRYKNQLTKDHFFKNNFSRMKAHLAVQMFF